jgi:polyhydroxybutyrate depolymerase
MASFQKLLPVATLLATAVALNCTVSAPYDTPGIHTIAFEHGGLNRSAIVVTPVEDFEDRETAPLVMHFHGLGATAAVQLGYTGMNGPTSDAGMWMVWPDGTPNEDVDTPATGQAWNTGTASNGFGCCGGAQRKGVDDLGFINKLLDTLETTICHDRNNVFLTGFSNGAFMTYYLTYNMADRIKAVAPISGLLSSLDASQYEQDLSNNDIPLLHIHEIGDQTVPIGGFFGSASAAQLVDAAATRQGCTVLPSSDTAVETFNYETATCKTAACPAGANATFCQVEGNKHVWFGAVNATPPFNDTGHIDATQEIVSFFLNHVGPEYDGDGPGDGASTASVSLAVVAGTAVVSAALQAIW